ncbi:MAG: hypothetical protein KKF41_11285 [Actinobacteria bacterium]|nr:hypothetical protein [Actinomycetota bacterium]MBU1944359.1 hypothetical protein [Actinomycetota bacterium]MBU2688158.1 hypothetical protein [Actinomycetota bacterium]
MGPHGRATVKADDYVESDEFAIDVSSWVDPWEDSEPIVAERAMYFDYNGIEGGHQALGAVDWSTCVFDEAEAGGRPGGAGFHDWYELYFAEGCTGEGFDEYICLYNPGSMTTPRVALELIDDSGRHETYEYVLPRNGRTTVRVDDLAAGRNVSARIKVVEGNTTIVAERSMYFDYGDGIRGGSVAPGVPRPALEWHFAEGYSGL